MWKKSYKNKHHKTGLPLPTEKQRMIGEPLPKKDLAHIKGQVRFGISIFCAHIKKAERKKLTSKINRLIKKKNFSILDVINESHDAKEVRSDLFMLYHYLKDNGEIYLGYNVLESEKIYFAKGWSQDKKGNTTAIHECIHLLHRLGVIKIDIPFAQASDRLYGLEKGLFSPKRKFALHVKDFDKKPRPDKILEGVQCYNEPWWSYDVGIKLGYWIFENLKGKKRWNYLYQRTMGLKHKEALEKIGFGNRTARRTA
ncbi:MAG: hypothetical protein NUV57_01095 [archaeon]|nr:hypothetical protein [archaeon]